MCEAQTTFLTLEHLNYLQGIEVAASSVLDARHMQRAEYQNELKRQNKALAYVRNACARGHGLCLRLSSGHCVQCSPVGLSTWKARHNPGVVYIAFSRKLGTYKIGNTRSSTNRIDSLNRDGYAGASDWVLLYRREFSSAGLVEEYAHSALAKWKIELPYTRLGHGTTINAKEVFACTYNDARAAVEKSMDLARSPPTEFKR